MVKRHLNETCIGFVYGKVLVVVGLQGWLL